MAGDSVLLMVSTRKGVFMFERAKGAGRWDYRGPLVGGQEVSHTTLDPRDGRIYAAYNDPWFGPQIRYSSDRGDSWTDASRNPRFRNDPVNDPDAGGPVPWFMRTDRVVEGFWHIEPGSASAPDTLYCGVCPAALFRSEDGGDTWEENEALSNHETRPIWMPGAGGLAAHSVVVDETNPDRMWVAISAAGVFRTDDGGQTWQPKNDNVRDEDAQFDPNVELYPTAGQ